MQLQIHGGCAIFLLAIETKLDLQTNIDTFPFSPPAQLSQQSQQSQSLEMPTEEKNKFQAKPPHK